MIRTLLDVALNIIVPLLCLIGSGIYVYRSGRYLYGILITWALLFIYEITSLALGTLVTGYAPHYSGLFEEGPGVFAMLVIGWIPGIVVSLISMLTRYTVSRIRQRKKSEAANAGSR